MLEIENIVTEKTVFNELISIPDMGEERISQLEDRLQILPKPK